MTDGIPHLAFDSAEVPVGEGRGRWEALVGAYDVQLPEGATEADFAVASESWLLGELVVTRGRLSPVELRRSVERIAADGRDTFTFGLVTRGHLAGDFDGRACELRPGQVCVIDFARPWRAATDATDFILIAVPRASIVGMAPRAGDLHGRLLDGATARILAEHFAALVRHLPQASLADAPVIQRTTLRMIAESLESLAPAEPAEPGPMDGRVAFRVRRHVEARLASGDLSPGAICQALALAARPSTARSTPRAGSPGTSSGGDWRPCISCCPIPLRHEAWPSWPWPTASPATPTSPPRSAAASATRRVTPAAPAVRPARRRCGSAAGSLNWRASLRPRTPWPASRAWRPQYRP